MKKIIAMILTAVMMVSAMAIPSFATTKADLLTEAAKSPVYKYVKVAVENAARSVTITDEQAAQILPLVKKAVAVTMDHTGPTVVTANGHRTYTAAEVSEVMGCIDQALKILGFTYTMTPSTNSKHANDIVFKVYDQNNKLIFTYDGDIVADTSSASYDYTWVVLAAGSALLVAGTAMFVVSRRKVFCA